MTFEKLMEFLKAEGALESAELRESHNSEGETNGKNYLVISATTTKASNFTRNGEDWVGGRGQANILIRNVRPASVAAEKRHAATSKAAVTRLANSGSADEIRAAIEALTAKLTAPLA